MESFFKRQMKQTLQRSALSHLLAIDEAKVESLLLEAEPHVRSTLLIRMISQARSAKKFDRALELLSRITSIEPKAWFPYDEATQLMLDLPPERDRDKQEIFRRAMAADREQHSLAIGSDDFASMVVRFWQHVPPAIVRDAIHQVIDATYPSEGISLNGTSGKAAFSNEHDYRVFEPLPILRQLDNDEADKLLQSSQQVQLQLKHFPNGIQSLDPSIRDTAPKEGESVHMLGGSIGGLDQGVSNETEQLLNATNARVREVVRMAEDNPRQAIAAAATLPESVGQDLPREFPRAEAYLEIARALIKRNASAAKDALDAMAESLKPAAHGYRVMNEWVEGILIAKRNG
jgi:hypothetical protein